jgi:hypothetical protein
MLSGDPWQRPRRALSCGFAWPKEQKSIRLAKLTNDIVVVPGKVLVVAHFVLLLPAALLRA